MEYTLSGGSRCRRGSPQEEDPCIFSDFPSRKVKNGNAKEAADRAVARWLSREYQRIQQGQVGKMSKGDGSSSWGARRDRERPQQRDGGQPGCARDLAPQTRPAGQSPGPRSSGINAGGSRLQRGWSQSSSSLPALLDLRGLAIIRDDLRPRGPALPQPICLAHSAAAPPTPPPAPAMNRAVARTASTGRAEMT